MTTPTARWSGGIAIYNAALDEWFVIPVPEPVDVEVPLFAPSTVGNLYRRKRNGRD